MQTSAQISRRFCVWRFCAAVCFAVGFLTGCDFLAMIPLRSGIDKRQDQRDNGCIPTIIGKKYAAFPGAADILRYCRAKYPATVEATSATSIGSHSDAENVPTMTARSRR